MDETQITATLRQLAGDIVNQASDRNNLVLIGIHTGGVYIAKRLKKIMKDVYDLEVPIGALDITLYRDDWTRLHTQPVLKSTDIPFAVDDKEVLLVDDVLFTGRTIRAALDALIDYGRPKLVRVVVLVDRGHRELPIYGEFVGIKVDTKPYEKINVYLKEKDGFDRVTLETGNFQVEKSTNSC